MSHSLPIVVAISGSVNRPSRSRLLAQDIVAQAQRHMAVNASVFDLVDAGPGLGAAFFRPQLSDSAREMVEAIESADAIIAVSPVYKGSYTGLFKHLFDFVEPSRLAGKPVVIGATGGGQRHGLVVEHQIRPLFGFFCAMTAPTSVYASDGDFEDGVLAAPSVIARAAAAGSELAALLRLVEAGRDPERRAAAA